MQNLTGSPRDELTADQVRAALTAASVRFAYGVDLLDSSLAFVEALDVSQGTVSHDATATVQGTLDVATTYKPAPTDRLRPWLSVSNGLVVARFNMGVYAPETPTATFGRTPVSYRTIGYDSLASLNRPLASSFVTAGGAVVLTEVTRLLTAAGFQWPTRVDTSATGKTYPAAGKTWAADGQNTYLGVLNDLLASVGYAQAWPDWDGRLRLAPWPDPTAVAPEWEFVVGDRSLGIVADNPTVTNDVNATSNQWPFTMNGVDGDPVDGTSRVVINNGGASATFDLGPSSQTALGGRVNAASPQGVDASTYADLVTQAKATALAAARATESIQITSRKFPMLWHRDVAGYTFATLGGRRVMQSTQWSIPLHGIDQATSTWQTVSGS